MQINCLTGLVEAKVANTTAQGKPKNFDEWIMRVMGEGIANLFMRPYNFKVNVHAVVAPQLRLPNAVTFGIKQTRLVGQTWKLQLT